jgi:hypothetical protein
MSFPVPLYERQLNIPEPDAGKGQGAVGISLNTFLASLASAAVIFTIEGILFLLVRERLPRI